MTIEADLIAAIDPLVGSRVYADIGPDGVDLPYVTFQSVGGEAANYMECTVVGRRNSRMQVRVWALSRLEASALSKQVEDAMVVSLKAFVLGAAISTYDDEREMSGTTQDFSVWY